MNKKVIFSKGYTARVTTWENDGDNYNTCETWVGSDLETANEYIKNEGFFDNPDLECDNWEDFNECVREFLIDNVGLSNGEWYHRVFASVELIYTPEDIILETEIIW